MRIGNYEVKPRPPFYRVMALLIVAPIALLFYVNGMLNTHWMASFRHPLAYSAMIPSDFDQLRQYPGAVYMHIHVYTYNHGIRQTAVWFENQNGTVYGGGERFSVPLWQVVAMANKYVGQPVATLFMFKENPWVKVWAIDVNGKRILSLNTAVANFRRGIALGYDWLVIAALLTLGGLSLYFEVERIRS